MYSSMKMYRKNRAINYTCIIACSLNDFSPSSGKEQGCQKSVERLTVVIACNRTIICICYHIHIPKKKNKNVGVLFNDTVDFFEPHIVFLNIG